MGSTTYMPLNTTTLPLDDAMRIIDLEEKFEDDDDVKNVFHTLEMSDELIAKLEKD